MRIVALMVRGPAKPIRALGSAKTTSPSEAKLAATPPIVGLVSTEMNSPPAVSKRASAAETLAICISESMPSCMRAPPPEPETMISGNCCSVARSIGRVSFSPTTEPMLPMMKAESVTPKATRRPRIMPVPTTAASLSPVRSCSSLSRSR